MRKAIRRMLMVVAAAAGAHAVAETPDRLVALAHPAVKWMLQFELPNALEQYNQYKEGAGAYATGQTMDQREMFSMAIHSYPGASDAKSCRDLEAANIRKNPALANLTIETSESGEAAYLRTRGTAQIEGKSIFTQHLHRFVFRDGLCAKVHLSSMHDDKAVLAGIERAAGSMVIRNAADTITRSFHLPPNGTLILPMAAHWGFQTSNPYDQPSRTLTFTTPDGNFQFMFTVFRAAPDLKETTQAVTLKTAESARAQAVSRAVQTQIPIQSMKGRHGEGHFIFVTDKSLVGRPAMPNNWKHMRQGMLSVGAMFATFTVFSNDENAPDALRAMQVLEAVQYNAP